MNTMVLNDKEISLILAKREREKRAETVSKIAEMLNITLTLALENNINVVFVGRSGDKVKQAEVFSTNDNKIYLSK